MALRLKIRPSFFVYVLLVVLFSSIETAFAALAALAVHEAAHVLVALWFKEPVQSIEITPFGGVITYCLGRSSSKGVKGILLAIAGPAANYLMILLASYVPLSQSVSILLGKRLIHANLSMLLINLLPALPLDGGNALFSICYYLFSVSTTITVLCIAGTACGSMMICLGIYGAFQMGTLNASLLMIGGYLMVYSVRVREGMLLENMYTVIQERIEAQKQADRIHAYRVHWGMELYRLLKPIANVPAALFFVEDPHGTLQVISEKRICKALLEMPYATIEESVMHMRE